MKKLLAILLCLSEVAWGVTPTIVQHKNGVATTGSVVSATFTSTVTAGHAVYACVSVNIGGTVVTPTMTGETFVKQTSMSVSSGVSSQIQCYKIASAVGGQTVVTETGATCSGCGWNLIIVEVNCGGTCTDESQGTSHAACSPTCSVSTGASATASNLNLAFFADDTANDTWTPQGSYVTVDTAADADGNAQYAESITAASTAIQTATVNISGSGDVVSAGITSIKPPAVAGTSGFDKRKKLNKYDS